MENFVIFGEMENYLQTGKKYEEVALWHSVCTDIIHHLVLDTHVNVTVSFGRLKVSEVLFLFVLHLDKILKVGDSIPFTSYKP